MSPPRAPPAGAEVGPRPVPSAPPKAPPAMAEVQILVRIAEGRLKAVRLHPDSTPRDALRLAGLTDDQVDRSKVH